MSLCGETQRQNILEVLLSVMKTIIIIIINSSSNNIKAKRAKTTFGSHSFLQPCTNY